MKPKKEIMAEMRKRRKKNGLFEFRCLATKPLAKKLNVVKDAYYRKHGYPD